MTRLRFTWPVLYVFITVLLYVIIVFGER